MLSKKGFTLVELLVVIAIIGILSSVAIVNLNSAREKAKAANVQSTLGQITTAAIVCQDDGKNLTYTGSTVCPTVSVGTSRPIAGQVVCVGASATWPTLETGWIYEPNCTSDYQGTAWSFAACEDGTDVDTNCDAGKRNITCTNAGCIAGTNP